MDGARTALLAEKLLRLAELQVDSQLAQAQGTFMSWRIAVPVLMVAFMAGVGLAVGVLTIFRML